MRRPSLALAAALAALGLLAGCVEAPGPGAGVPPPSRPALDADDGADARDGPSARSLALARYYARFEASQRARGLMRTDGGGVDTPFDARMVRENFERIAFFDEYERGAGLRQARDTPVHLRRWAGPIRVSIEHGAWTSPETVAADRAEIADYVARLHEVTGHPMRLSETDPNYHVIFASIDETPDLARRIGEIVPNASPDALEIFADLSPNIHCLVIAFSNRPQDFAYTRAIAIIRAEHPPLMRRSCIHEEIAQGLGLANDSPRARPSIFNDDDEFALLTTHDEVLLALLYDPALRPGMTLEEARPVIRARVPALIAARRPPLDG